jgi:hypothetical protein
VSSRRLTVIILGALGAGVIGLIGYLARLEAMTLKEAAGWALAGFLSLRELMSKIENVALGLRNSGSIDNPGDEP